MKDNQWRDRQDHYTLEILKKKREAENKKYQKKYGAKENGKTAE
jgi:hypothetical protein